MSSVAALYMAPLKLITPVTLPAVLGSTTTRGALDAGVAVDGAGRDSHPRRRSAIKNSDERSVFICLVRSRLCALVMFFSDASHDRQDLSGEPIHEVRE